jgi:hypothetical protein
MDTQERLLQLESRRREVSSAAMKAEARYLALSGELTSTLGAIERARSEWQNLEARNVTLAFQIRKIEELGLSASW